jgi:predicted  nucleic acid-binding Zn-ribbon protein
MTDSGDDIAIGLLAGIDTDVTAFSAKLEQAMAKFDQRFEKIETELEEQARDLAQVTVLLTEMRVRFARSLGAIEERVAVLEARRS